MNQYVLFTRGGQEWVISANTSDDAIRKIEAKTGDRVSCWFIGQRPSKWAKHF